MKNIMIILFLFVLLFNSITAQEILWKKNFGLSIADDIGRSVIETSDGGIAVVGYTGSFSGSNDVWLIKTNADGDTLWTRTYGGSNGDFGYSIKETNDDGFIIGGATYSYGVGGADFYLIRTDSNGDTLWTKTFGGVNDDFCLGLDIIDNGYILAGGKNNNLPFHPDIWIIKTDQSGNKIWEKTFGSNGDDVGYTIEMTNDGGFIIASEGLLIKTNSFGDSLWTKNYSYLEAGLRAAIQINTGEYILTGANWNGAEEVNVCLIKTDSLGNVIWLKTYDYQNDYDIGYSVQQTVDGGYIVCGSGQWDIDYGWIIRTNEFGDTLWTKSIQSYTLSPLANADTYCQSIIQGQNGDYIIAGSQTQISFQKEVMLLRIASDIVPVELTSFTATAEQNSVSLNWQTATETNNSGFEMQRSQMSNVNGQTDWQVIGFVPGFGTTTEPKSYSFIDENLPAGKYQYRLKQIDFDGTFEYSNTVEVEITSPTEFSLGQNYPNPFNPTTKIKYTIPSVTLRWQSHRHAQGDILVSLKLFDVLGNEIATLVNEQQQPGTYEVEFNVGQAISLSSGVYYYQLRVYPVSGAGGFVETKKMILTK